MKRDTEAARSVRRRNFLKAGAGAGATGLAALAGSAAQAAGVIDGLRWQHEADVVVIGSGATGLPAAIAARQGGASVILVEANFDVGGHAILSGGNVALGGGTSRQKRYGVEDSPDRLFADLTDWSVVGANGFPDYRYNDREIIRAFADNSAPTYEWLVECGVTFAEIPPDNRGAGSTGNSALRENHAVPLDFVFMQTGKPAPLDRRRSMSTGLGLIRPLEATARRLGVNILLEHRMTSLVREEPRSGRVIGITASHKGGTLNIRARKGVVIATGGSTGNVNFRRMFDPRLTEEYCGVAGEPYTVQDASGELAGMAVGASLWGGFNQTGEFGSGITKAGKIGCQYGYVNLTWEPGSPIFSKARATGLRVGDWQNVILVNQLGQRFYDETAGQFPRNAYGSVKNYVPGSWRNAADMPYKPANFLNAAMAGTGDAVNGGGPIWAIFDADAVAREKWTVTPPHVDIAEGFFFSGNTLAELARSIRNRFQRMPMPPEALERTVARYNSFVDAGADADFDKPRPRYRIERGPFHAAWSVPSPHDTRCGLRINARCQVIDMEGAVIAGLYCGGESAGGFSLHGLARCTAQGRIAGINAAAEPRQG
jgi:succinate dehydrogenase/fumarate reductase flavoprotein subunit